MYQKITFRCQILAIFLLGFVATLAISASAQDNTDFFMQFGASYGEDDTIAAYLDTISANLSDQNITLHEVRDADTHPMLTVLFANPARPYRDFGVTVNTPHELSASPLLLAHNDMSFGNKSVWLHNKIPDETLHTITTDMVTGLALYSLERCEDAAPYLQQAQDQLTALPTAQQAQDLEAFIAFYQGNCALLAGTLDDAADYYAAAQHDEATQFAATLNLAWIDITQGRVDAALSQLESLDKIIDLEPYNAFKIWLLNHRARLYAFGFDYATALSDINAAIAISERDKYLPNDVSELYVIRGEVHLLLYEWENARTDFNQALEVDATNAEAYFQRGILHYTLIERSAAIVDFEKYLELAPDGRYAKQAAQYVASIQIEIEASGD